MSGISINPMLIIVVIAALFKIVDGRKKGMVKEVISLITMLVLSVFAALAAYGLRSYNDGRVFNVIVVVILLFLLMIVHHVLSLFFFSAKLISKLPIVHFADKLLGIVFGVFEVVLVLWTLYAFIMMMDIGPIGQIILTYTEESSVLRWIYQHNYLALGIERFLKEFQFIPISIKF